MNYPPYPLQNDVSTITAQLISELEKAIIGKADVLRKITAVILAGGHILLEDYPGLAKTLIAKSFATVLGMSFHRIQFTPDLLPGDITGGYIFDRTQNQFVLRKGPIFANIVLADEINRASPRTQSALLEAMQEKQVTMEGETLRLPDPFIVIATQNPIEYEGTFPLPEAQLDRFMVKLQVGYPTSDEEKEIIRRRRERKQDECNLGGITDAAGVMEMRRLVEEVYLDPDVEQYIVDLTTKTRTHRKVAVGASPRGTLALMKLSRAWAAIHSRGYVLPDDIKLFIKPALSHRLILQPDLWLSPQAADSILDEVARLIVVPVLQGGDR